MVNAKTPLRWEDLPDQMTVSEVAAYFRTSRNWAYEAARSGVLKPAATHLGRAIRIRKDALQALLESGALHAN